MAEFESVRTPHGSTITQFPGHAKAVTADDSTAYESGISLYVGVGGDVAVVPADSDTGVIVVFPSVPPGAMLPCRVRAVKATNTTASGFVGVW